MSPPNQVEVVFIFADLAGFTALTETHGDLDAAKVAARYTEMTRAALQPGARLVKTIGDEVMIVAENTMCALQTALKLREAIDQEPLFPTVRIGLHGGSAVEQNGDYFGATVNLAARVAAHARMGQILCTRQIATEASRLPGVIFRARELAHLKNIADPVPLFEVVIGEVGAVADPIDPVCRMRIKQDAAPAQLPFGSATYYFCSFVCAKAFAEHPDYYASSPSGASSGANQFLRDS